ncbi:XRE family transcriptional regulator [Achromobacter xylosoxidans]|uniref:helix-turn-helix domain-containing protein n=1 Tax=Achromobacter TaxID=222 RepID=UPI00079AB308|nr:helix-turn-helix transcriptional regulator [Achromobacter mucicolens]KXJ66749.1 XRE family transcriptional regulator [Achromobacter xylosoxidans]MDH1524813.1 helix-turn-helix domain-containing protein [Achromobacter mucicolens]UAN04780.1 helix-turn-helix domain-containing protein [Achromobacter mucicolens]
MEMIIPFSWRLPDVFVRSPDGVLHRVVRHATTTETIAKLEGMPSNTHLDCECKLDNGETLCWMGNDKYRQLNGGAIFLAVTAHTTPRGESRHSGAVPGDEKAASAPRASRKKVAGPKARLPPAVVNLKTGNDWSLIRAWREHLNISTAEMAARLGVDHSIYIELERPRPRPRQVILDRVSQALGVSPDQLDDSLLGGQFH